MQLKSLSALPRRLCTAGDIRSSPVPVIRACSTLSQKSAISVHPAREGLSGLKNVFKVSCCRLNW